MEGSSQSSRCAKASQSLVREYIKVIFIVSQALVYQRGECVIFSEVYVFTSVCLHAFAWMCLCSHRPLMLNWRAKWVSIPFQMFRQLLLKLYSNRRSLQDDSARCRSLKSLQIWRNVEIMKIEVSDRTVHHSSEAEYITVCRKPVKQSLAGAINRIGPCKHDSLSAKRCLAGAPLFWNFKGNCHRNLFFVLVQYTPGKQKMALPGKADRWVGTL